MGEGVILGCSAWRHVEPDSFCLSVRALQVAKSRPDRITFLQLNVPFRHGTVAWRRYGHCRLLGFYFEDILVAFNAAARLKKDSYYSRLGDGFAKLRHDNGYAWHMKNSGKA